MTIHASTAHTTRDTSTLSAAVLRPNRCKAACPTRADLATAHRNLQKYMASRNLQQADFNPINPVGMVQVDPVLRRLAQTVINAHKSHFEAVRAARATRA